MRRNIGVCFGVGDVEQNSGWFRLWVVVIILHVEDNRYSISVVRCVYGHVSNFSSQHIDLVRPVISSGNIEPRTSRSSFCSSMPMLGTRLHCTCQDTSAWSHCH